MAAAYTALTGEAPCYNGMPESTDGTSLNTWVNVHIVTTGVGELEIPHHSVEWVSVDELFATCKLHAATAMYSCYDRKEAHV